MTIHSTPGAEKEFTKAYDLFADPIFRHCAYRCFNRERAQELMQEAFMKAWEYLADGNSIDNVQAFLYRTANNLIVDEARRAKRRTVVSFEDMREQGFDVAGDDGRDMGKQFGALQVAAVLQKIDEPYRTTVIMRFIDELQPKEIAEALGETANVISVRITRGLKLLQGLLPKHG